MTQSELNQNVAERTGELISVIESRGFSLVHEEFGGGFEE
jgi:hypothetical protein|eukprot:COSAG05_NODE_8075_length_739_cov_0.643750_1_plen_40_part_00